MNYYEVSPIGIIGKDFAVLTYSSESKLLPGQIVEIPVGSRKFVGVVLRKVPAPDFDCKEILRVLFDTPLPSGILKLHNWISEFYSAHPGTVWQTILPSGLNKNRRAHVAIETTPRNPAKTIQLNASQSSALAQILDMKSGTAILHGITGSGKTEVYKSLARRARDENKSAIILVPEISLTAQLVDEFRRDFPIVIVTHSTMTEAERTHIWWQCLESTEPLIVVGPRSALFMPLRNLGLIVIDECHEPSYKQEKSPRYHALRAASVLAGATDSQLILGSATPSIADYYSAKKLDRPIIKITELARANAKKPIVEIVDLTRRDNYTSESKIFSRQLLKEMKEVVAQKKQVLLFHNRRGSASTTMCEECGWIAMCSRCFLPLTLHADKFILRCHICGFKEKPPTKCVECGAAEVLHKGIGTKRIEEEIRKIFPNINVKRFDGDTERGQNVHDLFDELKGGRIDVIIGTQQIAKGLDLPNLRLVGIVQADAGLNLPDFSSAERTFQLIAQASGRVGRGSETTKVIVQTYQPNAPAVRYGAAQNYDEFYAQEIIARSHGHFPPFSHLLKLTCSYKTERSAITASQKLTDVIRCWEIEQQTSARLSILGPTPAFYERQRDNYRWQIVVRAQNRQILQQITKIVPPAHWQTELDPNSLI
ncbi:primosomal protein N' [Candidatus Saccharibacteria bacterium]|nr:primosomal protein N' [Candidatus Saccharibacteria bacterium]MCL1963150.1 primosomal protein N' [Candidatus Saccharibacteria bacterium]